eukprot:TRINITY_DN42162_c0_g1_i1.p1 TRINITY_DN42162_c0_g1~~TRINITY_DN42162_c0_g1_i1.p1  ORF type:complete len:420 (-),score=79.88 TRINITY_DN42162_c0_g1_i1:287-1546(-)
MSQIWEVVGGAASGGIICRTGLELSSPKTPERLSTGALIRQLALEGERLHFERLTGSGPAEAWCGITLNNKDLVVRSDKKPPVDQASEGQAAVKAESAGGYGSAAAAVAAAPGPEAAAIASTLPVVVVDSALKASVEAAARSAAADIEKWCTKYIALKYPLPPGKCKFRVICFHNAGSAESVWTGSPLLAWAKERGDVELVAMSYPGRDKLLKTPPHESAGSLVDALLPVLHHKLADGVPYAIVSHSVGTWVAFEFLVSARKIGLPMPQVGCFSAFPAPQMPEARRPWRCNRKLDDSEMMAETTSWDKEHFGGAAKMVLEEPEWSATWRPLMRADFRLFDEYAFTHGEAPKFDFPIFSYHMQKEHYISQDMVELWREWTTGKFTFEVLPDMGHLTCLYQPAKRKVYCEKLIAALTAAAS